MAKGRLLVFRNLLKLVPCYKDKQTFNCDLKIVQKRNNFPASHIELYASNIEKRILQ